MENKNKVFDGFQILAKSYEKELAKHDGNRENLLQDLNTRIEKYKNLKRPYTLANNSNIGYVENLLKFAHSFGSERTVYIDRKVVYWMGVSFDTTKPTYSTVKGIGHD